MTFGQTKQPDDEIRKVVRCKQGTKGEFKLLGREPHALRKTFQRVARTDILDRGNVADQAFGFLCDVLDMGTCDFIHVMNVALLIE